MAARTPDTAGAQGRTRTAGSSKGMLPSRGSNGASPTSVPTLTPLGKHAGTPPIRLKRPVMVVGSRPGCRIHLVSSSVSKAHALLVQTDRTVYVLGRNDRQV